VRSTFRPYRLGYPRCGSPPVVYDVWLQPLIISSTLDLGQANAPPLHDGNSSLHSAARRDAGGGTSRESPRPLPAKPGPGGSLPEHGGV
jgi:hypothetical protein